MGIFVLKNFHSIEGLFPAACSFRKWVESVVLLSGEGASFQRLIGFQKEIDARTQGIVCARNL